MIYVNIVDAKNRKIMKKPILLLLSLLICVITYGQKVQYEDVVYLKNGSIVRGMITEQVPGQAVTIKTADKNIFVFDVGEIEKITKEELPAGSNQEFPVQKSGSYNGKQKGFEGTVDLMLAMQLGWGEPVMGMSAVVGYRFMPQLFIGGGAGVEMYSEETMLPLMLQVRTDFVEAKVSPFFVMNAGYAFGWVNEESGSDWGGMFMEPGIGFRFNIAEHFGLNISSSFKFQRAYFNHYYWLSEPYPGHEHSERNQETYRLFTFKVGFSF